MIQTLIFRNMKILTMMKMIKNRKMNGSKLILIIKRIKKIKVKVKMTKLRTNPKNFQLKKLIKNFSNY